MARKIRRLVLLLLLVLLPAPLCVEAGHLTPKEFIPHTNDVTWHAAQTHCMEIHHDLITINDQVENRDIFALGGWIGLHLEGSEWKWSRRGERATYTRWKSGEQYLSLSEPALHYHVLKYFCHLRSIVYQTHDMNVITLENSADGL